MRDPGVRKRILSEKSEPLAGDGSPVPPFVDQMLAQIDILAGRMFPMEETVDYEPPPGKSFLAAAQQKNCRPLEAIYDYLVSGDGSQLVYFPVFNYAGGTLDVVYEMLNHPRGFYIGTPAGDSWMTPGFICMPVVQSDQTVSLKLSKYPFLKCSTISYFPTLRKGRD